jgi:hypothetical protein
MGDKSPKSNNKQKNQKQAKTDDVQKKKHAAEAERIAAKPKK